MFYTEMKNHSEQQWSPLSLSFTFILTFHLKLSVVVTDVTLLAGNFKNRQIDWQRVVWSPIAAILLNTFLMCDTSLKKDEKSLSFYKSVFSEFWDYGL